MRICTILLSVVLCLVLSTVVYAGDAEKLIGVWERVSHKNLDTGESHTMPFRLMCTKKYYSVSFTNPEREKTDKPIAELTAEELRDSLQMIFHHGTYSVSGNKLNRHLDTAHDPNSEGTDSTREFRFEGVQLVIKGKNSDGQAWENRLKRLEQLISHALAINRAWLSFQGKGDAKTLYVLGRQEVVLRELLQEPSELIGCLLDFLLKLRSLEGILEPGGLF